MSEAPLPPKKDVAIALLKGPSVYVHLDPRSDGVIVPKWFKKQPQLVLQLGLNMPVPIPDLEVGDDGITATLSFNRSPFWCFMPYDAIYALVGEDGRGMVWPEDVPGELAAEKKRPALKVVDNKKPKKKAQRAEPDEQADADDTAPEDKGDKPKLGLAPAPPPSEPSTKEATEGDEGSDDDEDGKSKLPPYLRVVK